MSDTALREHVLHFLRGEGAHVGFDRTIKDWPPELCVPPDDGAWDDSVAAFRADLTAMIDLVNDPATDLFARIPHGDGQTVLREALLIADHNSYHLGQLVVIRRALGVWSKE